MYLSLVDEAPFLVSMRLEGEDLSVPVPTFSADGSLLVVWDQVADPVCVWRTASGQPLLNLHTSCNIRPALTHGNDRMAVASYDEITVWEIATGRLASRFPWHGTDAIYQYQELYFDRGGQTLTLLTAREVVSLSLTGAAIRVVHRFDPQDYGLHFASPVPGTAVVTLYWPHRPAPTGEEWYAPYHLSKLDLQTGKRLFTTGEIWAVQCTPDRRGALLLCDPHEGRYEIWDTGTARRCGSLTVEFDPLWERLKLSPDARYLVWSDTDTSLSVWDARREAVVHRIDTGGYYHVEDWSPTHRILALVWNQHSQNVDRTLFLDPLTGIVLGQAEGHQVNSRSHAFSPCGRWYASVVDAAASGRTRRPDPSGTIYLTDLAPILPLAKKWKPTSVS